MHIHIDPIGGIAGDMFVAAMLDLLPHLEEDLLHSLNGVDALKSVKVQLAPHSDSVLTGKRFVVEAAGPMDHHTHYTELVDCITSSALSDRVKRKAINILDALAEAEAAVHGAPRQDIVLHEAGSPDSLADIICSAFLIDAVNDASWSCGSIPVGRGTVKTAHGELPLPAPAVVQLLKGCPVHNDGREGERVTPTGAAILRTLSPRFGEPNAVYDNCPCGTWFRRKCLCRHEHIVRLTAYEPLAESVQFEQIAVLTFEVDDQSLEDLSIGLEQLRKMRGVWM